VEALLRRAQSIQVVRNHGRVIQLIGLVIESEGPLVSVVKFAGLNLPGTMVLPWPKWSV